MVSLNEPTGRFLSYAEREEIALAVAAEHLTAVAAQLNGRPRMTLNWCTPAEALNELLSNPYPTNNVATNP